MHAPVRICDWITIGQGHPLALIAGPCVLESLNLAMRVAFFLSELSARLSLPVIFKGSYDKANRTAIASPRGPGLANGLSILRAVKARYGLPVTTDIHEPRHAADVAEVVDLLQIPAFLCRQTDLLLAAGQTGKPVNIKKGQFMAPADMRQAALKVLSLERSSVLLTERGTTFGYNNLVVDFRSLAILRSIAPVIFDATHSVQRPAGSGTVSAGDREYVAPLARAAAAAGIDALFLEIHPDPAHALSDGPNSLPLDAVEPLLRTVLAIRAAAQEVIP